MWGSRFVFRISDGCNGAKSIKIIIHDLISVWSARIAQNDEINTDWINEYLNFMWWINEWQNVKLATWHINTHTCQPNWLQRRGLEDVCFLSEIVTWKCRYDNSDPNFRRTSTAMPICSLPWDKRRKWIWMGYMECFQRRCLKIG